MENKANAGRALAKTSPLGMQRELLQITAMVTMLIDHVGAVFFPEHIILRMIGRLAFPLYAFGIVQGYLYTSNVKKYMLRLGLLALISQVPFSLALDANRINVIGTFFVCVLTLYWFDRLSSSIGRWTVLGVAIWLLEAVPTDYGNYALALIFMYRYAAAHWAVAVHLVLNGLYTLRYGIGVSYQFLSVLSTVWLTTGHAKQRIIPFAVPRWLWLSFYPAHLLVLAIIKWV
ncbi:TraX family protein [Paenibacillus xerothermodurans]|uniref:Conjugal transfer protein TraX n=1 Tax=Paenibacillus xerothermodurans TaxID=1977292 RepID=A0A2W1NW93_PAEXE|nr:TraX family protein [Paenibacillus xerothermodurans]PZE19932.1 conjugal transfer protein TraX [Paenibacillus xerothermodurans]